MRKIVRFFTAFILLVSIVGAAGCSSEPKEPVVEDTGAVRMMKMLPIDVGSFMYMDVHALRTVQNLSSIWDWYKDELGDLSDSDIIESVDFVGMAQDEDFYLIEGDFDLDQLMGNTTDGPYYYDSFNVTIGEDGDSAALVNGVFIIGCDEDVRSCIDVVNGKKDSLYDNGDLRTIFDRLPSGYMISLVFMEDAYGVGLRALGKSMAIQDSNYVQTIIAKFANSDIAGNFVRSVIMGTATVTQDGVFITIVESSQTPPQNQWQSVGVDGSEYDVVREDIQTAVIAYAVDHSGNFPTLNGTYTNDNCYQCGVLSINAMHVANGGALQGIPDGLWKGDGASDDNCDTGSGFIGGCSASYHYIWIVDQYGTVFSYCMGDGCTTSNTGYQGVWP